MANVGNDECGPVFADLAVLALIFLLVTYCGVTHEDVTGSNSAFLQSSLKACKAGSRLHLRMRLTHWLGSCYKGRRHEFSRGDINTNNR